MPVVIQNGTNYLTMQAQYYLKYKSHIEPYKLGKINTKQFLENLSELFPFIKDIDEPGREKLLADAWSSSIKLGPTTEDRFRMLVDIAAADKQVYLISNTNELDVRTILNLLQEKHSELEWYKEIDISVTSSKEPIKILDNVYLCLSYRYGAFKEQTATTMSLLEELSGQYRGPKTLVSQYSGDLNKAKELNFNHVLNVEEFYNIGMSNPMSPK